MQVLNSRLLVFLVLAFIVVPEIHKNDFNIAASKKLHTESNDGIVIYTNPFHCFGKIGYGNCIAQYVHSNILYI